MAHEIITSTLCTGTFDVIAVAIWEQKKNSLRNDQLNSHCNRCTMGKHRPTNKEATPSGNVYVIVMLALQSNHFARSHHLHVILRTTASHTRPCSHVGKNASLRTATQFHDPNTTTERSVMQTRIITCLIPGEFGRRQASRIHSAFPNLESKACTSNVGLSVHIVPKKKEAVPFAPGKKALNARSSHFCALWAKDAECSGFCAFWAVVRRLSEHRHAGNSRFCALNNMLEIPDFCANRTYKWWKFKELCAFYLGIEMLKIPGVGCVCVHSSLGLWDGSERNKTLQQGNASTAAVSASATVTTTTAMATHRCCCHPHTEQLWAGFRKGTKADITKRHLAFIPESQDRGCNRISSFGAVKEVGRRHFLRFAWCYE